MAKIKKPEEKEMSFKKGMQCDIITGSAMVFESADREIILIRLPSQKEGDPTPLDVFLHRESADKVAKLIAAKLTSMEFEDIALRNKA